MKELETHNAPTEWHTARVAYEWMQGFHFHQTGVSKRLRFLSNTAEDPTDLDEILLTDKCTILGFQSIIVHGRTPNTMMMGHCLNVMTQVPYPDNKADLPNRVYIMRMYTELKDGSWSVAIVLWNLNARPIHLGQGCVIGCGRSQNTVPIASTQVAIKGIVQYSTVRGLRAQFLAAQLVTRRSREHMLSAVGPDAQVE